MKVKASLHQGAEFCHSSHINTQDIIIITVADKLRVVEFVGEDTDNVDDISNSDEGNGEHRQQGSDKEDQDSLRRGVVGVTDESNYKGKIDDGHRQEGEKDNQGTPDRITLHYEGVPVKPVRAHIKDEESEI